MGLLATSEAAGGGDAAGGGRLAGKVAAVTGASRGIGLALAAGLAEAGAQVLLLARGVERLAAAADALGPPAVAVPADVGDPDSVRAAFGTIEDRCGCLDVLVNNAAVGWPDALELATDERLEAQVRTNLLGPLFTMRAAIPLMRRAGGGDIVNVSSETAHQPLPHLATYAATKAALEIATQGVIHELRRDRIRVGLLRAGKTRDGELTADWGTGARDRAVQEWQGFRAAIPGDEPQAPERVAEALLFMVTRPRDSILDVASVRAWP